MSIANLSEPDRKELHRYVEDLVRYAVEVREYSEQAQALGVPPVAFQRHVLTRVSVDKPLQVALNEFRPVAEGRLGAGAFRENEVRRLLGRAVQSQRECEHLKKILRGFKADQFAIEKYVEIRSHNPLDKGLAHLREISLLAGAELEELTGGAVHNLEAGATTASDPDQKASQHASATVAARRTATMRLLVDVAIGLGIGASALMLLT